MGVETIKRQTRVWAAYGCLL